MDYNLLLYNRIKFNIQFWNKLKNKWSFVIINATIFPNSKLFMSIYLAPIMKNVQMSNFFQKSKFFQKSNFFRRQFFFKSQNSFKSQFFQVKSFSKVEKFSRSKKFQSKNFRLKKIQSRKIFKVKGFEKPLTLKGF